MDRSKILFLAIGLILGYWLFHSERPASISGELPSPNLAPPQAVTKDDPVLAAPQIAPALPGPRQETESTASDSKESGSEDKPVIGPQSGQPISPQREHTLRFDETYLVALENGRVHDWAYTRRKPGGWEIQILDENSPFRAMGFSSGDWIRDAALDEIPRVDLRQRLIAILSRIER